jgi:hypothetical protein
MSVSMVRESDRSDASERVRELASILTRGVLRLHSRTALVTEPGQHGPPEKPHNSSPDCLELGAETRLSVPHGLTARETRDTGENP